MMRITKDDSLLMAEAVVAILSVMVGDGSDVDQDVDLEICATTIGRSSALRIHDDHNRRFAWVMRHQVSGGIQVVFGSKADNTYEFKGVPMPVDSSPEAEFNETQYYAAAGRIFEFFTQ
jgi:hypothetical protein